MQLFHIIFTEPGKVILEVPCIVDVFVVRLITMVTGIIREHNSGTWHEGPSPQHSTNAELQLGILQGFSTQVASTCLFLLYQHQS